ncbi:MAG: signal recognition particle-docking protein FtsY [Planctomycetaceae bacterium]|jgi:fused signal recognition particle receptor|nr:signal recognition particle-docking protein FtsY [Planctomycetaceae bacterium]
MSIFSRFKSALSKAVKVLNTDIRDLFKTSGRIVDEEFLDELFAMLVKTDAGVAVAGEVVDEIRKQFRGRVAKQEDVVGLFKTKFKQLMFQSAAPINLAADKPTVIMICGVNGSGKTTTIAKLAKLFISQKKRVVLGAADTFRAAAAEQLAVWAERLGAEIVMGKPESDPASVAHNAISKTIETGADVCIVDTAGRLHTQKNLMMELEKIHRILGKRVPDSPHEVFLIIDATTGQNGINQANIFTEYVKCTGIILSKLDGTAKGGVTIAIKKQLNIPVKFVGLGESADDLEVFDSEKFVDAMFDETV